MTATSALDPELARLRRERDELAAQLARVETFHARMTDYCIGEHAARWAGVLGEILATRTEIS